MKFSYEQLIKLRDLSIDLDSLVESLQFSHLGLSSAIARVYEFLNQRLKIQVLFIKTYDEKLQDRVFTYGQLPENSSDDLPELKQIDEAKAFNSKGFTWFARPLEMAGSNTGCIAMALQEERAPESFMGKAILDCISEELDNFFFNIFTSRVKQKLIVEVQSALKNHLLIPAIDGAVKALKKEIPFKKLFILYTDKELTGFENYNYLVYHGSQRINDSFNQNDKQLDDFFASVKNPLVIDQKKLESILNVNDLTVSYLLDGLIEEELIGKVLLIPEEGIEFSIFIKDIIQVFSESLRQRLVDFNRERNTLRKFFSDKVINQLTSVSNYDKIYLTPREAEIGILFADLSGFTKISEQILKTPNKITTLIDHWTNGIIERVFPLGACLDKVVGDCVILLFGPPFYNQSPEEVSDNLLKAAKTIVEFTDEFLKLPENKDIQQHKDFKDFGVAIGANFCPAVVGLIGPNEDLTAFSSGMNITARLQGLATAHQILVTEKVYETMKSAPDWNFEGPSEAKVKNVAKTLKYYHLK
ncbi:MAG: adenylate/guanylate cyclase domain-containing protein [Candidatus Rifleibacteriota bacterium]